MTRSQSSHQSSRGFTLTEVLIVILIIAVLAALMFPLIKNMRSRAESSKCTQHLHQIGIALNAYISENSGRFPDGTADVSWSGFGRCWYDAAAENLGREYVPYHKGETLPAVFGCPAGHGKAYEPAWPYTGDYAGNLRLGNPQGVLTLAAVNNPSATPYVQDTVRQNQFGEWIFAPGYSKTQAQSFAARHNGKGNILWVDGHVSSMAHEAYMDFANRPAHGNRFKFVTGTW